MNILLLGANGQLGQELARVLTRVGSVHARSRAQIDLSDLVGLRDAVRGAQCDVIVNAAAYTAVDRAETEPDAAHLVNAEAVAVLGEEAKRSGAALIHYSTDFVFDGAASRPYTERDAPNPLGVYGSSKLAGEVALQQMDAPAVVLRTAWVYGLASRSFVALMMKLARERTQLSVVTDQVGSPTWTVDLARATATLIEQAGPEAPAVLREARGVYHAAGEGACSRFDLTRAILDLDPRSEEHVVQSLTPATSADFPAPARRPQYAPLDCALLADRFGVRLLHWREALEEALRTASQPARAE